MLPKLAGTACTGLVDKAYPRKRLMRFADVDRSYLYTTRSCFSGGHSKRCAETKWSLVPK
jgi:hypothetical protein